MSSTLNPVNSVIFSKELTSKKLRFDSELEKEYRSSNLVLSLDLFRYLAVLGMIFYGGFYIADCFVIQADRLIVHQIVRLMIVIPLSVVVLGLSYKKFFYTNDFLIEFSVIGSLLIGQGFHIFLSLSESIPGYYYLAVTIMIVLWGNSFPILRFSFKLVFTLTNMVLLPMFLYYFIHSEWSVIVFQLIFYIALSKVSLGTAYLSEQSKRNNFLKAQRLTENARAFTKVANMTAHELQTSMRIINGLSYIVKKDEKHTLSQKTLGNLDLIQEHILLLNSNLKDLKDHAVDSIN